MPTSANHHIPTPESTNLATIPADMKAMADKIDSELDAIGLNQITGVSPGKVLIANSSGVVTPRTVGGDATVSDTGVLDISPLAVGTNELADSAVTTAKISNGSITKAKMGSWFQVHKVTASGTISSGNIGVAILSHSLGHTNYVALLTVESSGSMAVSWNKGNLIGQDSQNQLTVWCKNTSNASVTSPTFTVLLMSLA